MRLSMDGVVTAQQVIAGFDVDHDLRYGICRHRELVRCSRLDEEARTEVEGSRRHGAEPIYLAADR